MSAAIDGSNYLFTQMPKTKSGDPMPKIRFPFRQGRSGEQLRAGHFFLDNDLTQVEVLHECFKEWQHEIQRERIASRNKVTKMAEIKGVCGRKVIKTWRDV